MSNNSKMTKEEGGMRYMSRSRYQEIEERVEDALNTEAKEKVMSIIRDVMKFNPEHDHYQHIKAKLTEQGNNTYTSYQKTYYERHKEELSRKRAERYRQKKELEKVAENRT